MRTRTLAASLGAVALISGGLALTLPAAAAVPSPVAGNVTVLSAAPRLVPSPGTALKAGETKTFQVSGTVGIPANATGVILSVSATKSAAAGGLTVYTTDAGKPGTPTVQYQKGGGQTGVASVGLNDKGQLNVHASAATNVLLAVQSYVTPVAKSTEPSAPVVKTIAKTDRKPIEVGGSFRARSTDLGSVTLPAGTYDARVLGSFRGLNTANNTVPEDVFLTGTFAITLGDEVAADFSNNITVGGITIPRSNSATLTQDPTASISTFFTLEKETNVHVRVFAYASNSSQAGSGELQAGLDSATFLRLS